jgi:hypothetical protein
MNEALTNQDGALPPTLAEFVAQAEEQTAQLKQLATNIRMLTTELEVQLGLAHRPSLRLVDES